MATWFRNSDVRDDVVYVGPMGCLTGMYIIMTGIYTVEEMRRLTIECLRWILAQDEVPAALPEAYGNYLLHDLPMCKWESSRFPLIPLWTLTLVFSSGNKPFRITILRIWDIVLRG